MATAIPESFISLMRKRLQGAGLPVLLDAGFIPERMMANVTAKYWERTGMMASVGMKYFV